MVGLPVRLSVVYRKPTSRRVRFETLASSQARATRRASSDGAAWARGTLSHFSSFSTGDRASRGRGDGIPRPRVAKCEWAWVGTRKSHISFPTFSSSHFPHRENDQSVATS